MSVFHGITFCRGTVEKNNATRVHLRVYNVLTPHVIIAVKIDIVVPRI